MAECRLNFKPIEDVKSLYSSPHNFILNKPIETIVYIIGVGILTCILPHLLALPLMATNALMVVSIIAKFNEFKIHFQRQLDGEPELQRQATTWIESGIQTIKDCFNSVFSTQAD